MTIQVPAWLNPAVMPPPELLADIEQAIDAVDDIKDAPWRFVHEHRATMFRYSDTAHKGLPDDVWSAVDTATGFARLQHPLTYSSIHHTRIDAAREHVTASLDADTYMKCRQRGATMTYDEIIAYTLDQLAQITDS